MCIMYVCVVGERELRRRPNNLLCEYEDAQSQAESFYHGIGALKHVRGWEFV